MQAQCRLNAGPEGPAYVRATAYCLPPTVDCPVSELHMRLGEQAALEQFGVGRAIDLLERDDHAKTAMFELTPVGAAKEQATL